MRKYRFYKDELGWFIDLKFFPFNKAWLAMVQGADKLLDQISAGKNEVELEISTSPIPYSDGMLEKQEENLQGLMSGRMYKGKTGYTESINSKVDSIWLCAVTLWVFWKYPEKIYYKIVK